MSKKVLLTLAACLVLGACATQKAERAGSEMQATQAQAELSADEMEQLEQDLTERRGAIRASNARTRKALKALYEGQGFAW
jgi:outer membrane lipoprotein-sorting protein